VRSILKALGLTIWGAIAVLFSVVFIIVAFQVVMKYRASRSALDLEKELNSQSRQSEVEESAASVALPAQAPHLGVPGVVPRAAEATDCANGHAIPRVTLDSAKRARLERLLNTTAAAKDESGDAFLQLGKLYYGFEEYELAVVSIELGLGKGRISRLDEAYVYLGRSEVAIGDLEAAREAFEKLKGIPNISPRVLRLWTLYAETRLTTSDRPANDGGECRNVGG
jgi:tetratricopeptide (TPR) repeat protein